MTEITSPGLENTHLARRAHDKGVLPQKTLSVVISNYNHARYLPVALQAVLSQSCRPMEVIVIDDCSTDNSVEVIEEFVRRDPIIRLYRNEQNQGVIFSTNRGLGLATLDRLDRHLYGRRTGGTGRGQCDRRATRAEARRQPFTHAAEHEGLVQVAPPGRGLDRSFRNADPSNQFGQLAFVAIKPGASSLLPETFYLQLQHSQSCLMIT
jgi:hypothetical protein